MVSVFTELLLLAICLSTLVHGEKSDETSRILNQVRPRDIFPNPTQYTPNPCLTASGTSRALLSSGFAKESGWFPVPAANTGSNVGSNRVVPYPTDGAPYQNSTSLYTEQGNGESENGKNRSCSQCPSQQTVTLPPQTITLPAQTVTITPAPETVTITPQAQTESVTITVTPQTQTTTVTLWITVTANQAPSCPGPTNIANPPIAPVPVPNEQPSITPIASVLNNASTPAIIPPIVTPQNIVVPISTGAAAPIINATSPVIPQLGPSIANGPMTFPAKNHTSPGAQQTSFISSNVTETAIKAPYPYRNTTNQTLPLGSGPSRDFRPTGSGFAKATNRHISSYFVSKFVTDTPIKTIVIGTAPIGKYYPGGVSSLSTPPSQANVTALQPKAGPTAPPSPVTEYFPDDGSTLLTPPAQANATTSPVRESFPDDGSSLLAPPPQANATSVSPMGGPKVPVTMSAGAGSSQSSPMMVISIPPPPIIQSNTSSPTPPTSTSAPQPPPSTLISSTSQPPNNSSPAFCTNGTTAQNISQNVRPLPPSSPPAQPH